MKSKLKIFTLLFAASFIFTACDNEPTPRHPSQIDVGVVIDGIRWATRNVDFPGTFVDNPQDAGMFFQWNRRQGWNTTDEYVEGWDSSIPEGEIWERRNDPCPIGWRVPTYEELTNLQSQPNAWTTKSGVNGHLFGTYPNQIFLPVAGFRFGNTGSIHLPWALTNGNYWSSTQHIDREHARSLRFWDDGADVSRSWRPAGLLVRCVAEN